jgi:hypothetical protein
VLQPIAAKLKAANIDVKYVLVAARRRPETSD